MQDMMHKAKGLNALELLNRELMLWLCLYNNNGLLLLFLRGLVLLYVNEPRQGYKELSLLC